MMLRWNAVLSVLFLIAPVLRAGEPLFIPHGAAEAGMAFAVTATPGHWSCFNNQALMTSATGVSVSAAIETRFMMPALSSKGLSAVFVNGKVPLGIVVVHYGNADYHRIMTGLGSAVSLSGGVSLGVQADYITERASGDYRDASYLTFETGMACALSSSVTLGLHLFNPLTALNSLPSSIEAGLQWEYTKELLLTLCGSKTTSEPVSLQFGLRWDVAEHLALRSGYMTSPSSFALGLGWETGSLKTDLGFIVNSRTGITSALTFIWTIK